MKKSTVPKTWLICHNQKEWHNWLACNHERKSEVWLQIQKAGSMETGVYLKEAVEEAICYGWIDNRMFSIDPDKFILRMTPRKPGSMWSLINRKRAEALIAEGRMTGAGMASIVEAQANGNWQAAYTAKEATDLPDDLSAELQKDPVAKENFGNWSNSQKLQATVWVKRSRKPENQDEPD